MNKALEDMTFTELLIEWNRALKDIIFAESSFGDAERKKHISNVEEMINSRVPKRE